MARHPALKKDNLIRLACAGLLVTLAACDDGDSNAVKPPAGPDTTAPQVMITKPGHGAGRVATRSVLSAAFSEAIDPATLTPATFIVQGVQGRITPSDNKRSASFTPASPLRPNTRYTVTLTTGIKDLAGNALARNFSWSFTTRAATQARASTPRVALPRADAQVQQTAITAGLQYLADNPVYAYSLPFGATGIDAAEAISTDAAGNLYAAGYSGLKFFSGAGLSGQGSAGSADLLITKFDASGRKQWSHQLGTTGVNSAHAISSDAAGNVYAVGATAEELDGQSSAGGYDLFITKFDARGVKQWTRQLGTAGVDAAYAVATDTHGNVYAAGYTSGALDGHSSAGGYDLFISKFDARGVQQWTRQLGTAASDYAKAIASDADGNVYVAGYTNGALDGHSSAGDYDLLIAKYDARGVRLWARQLGSAGMDAAYAITTDAAGNVYAAGYTSGALDGHSSAGGADVFIAGFDASGGKRWIRQLGTAAYDTAQAISSDAAGNVYLAGYTSGVLDGHSSAGGVDLFICKFDASGSKRWTRQLGTAAYDAAQGISSDTAGNVYAAGYTNAAADGQGSAGGGLFIVKYQSDGHKH